MDNKDTQRYFSPMMNDIHEIYLSAEEIQQRVAQNRPFDFP